MLRQSLRYGFGLIALYVVVSQGSNFGTVITEGAEGISTVTKALQGR